MGYHFEATKSWGSNTSIACMQFACKMHVPFAVSIWGACRILVNPSSGGWRLLGGISTNLFLSRSTVTVPSQRCCFYFYLMTCRICSLQKTVYQCLCGESGDPYTADQLLVLCLSCTLAKWYCIRALKRSPSPVLVCVGIPLVKVAFLGTNSFLMR